MEIDPTTAAAMNAALAPLPQSTMDLATVQVIAGGLDAIDYDALAQQGGMSTSKAREVAQFLHNQYEGQAALAAYDAGCNDVHALMEWARENRPDGAGKAARALVFEQNTAELKALAKDYLRSAAPDLATLKKGGYDAWHDRGTGEDMVNVRGHVMTAAAAAKQGLV